ncbi:hypothetical protein [Sulfuritalea sp.]|uniref:hypothetical protein n=1 Tax=Sulfuritalea sp. TaxID=2480090 RepID=UPI001AC6E27E|nr:hypothetical protein [Sulfuritalea sp.]MBN8474513.1 hypothetical protein [Sulfuritalea sp.]
MLALPKNTQHSRQAFINKLRNNPDYRRTNYLSKPCQRPFPGHNDIGYRHAIEAQGPLVTVNDDGSFSARGLTDWYIGAFIELNHLTGTDS